MSLFLVPLKTNEFISNFYVSDISKDSYLLSETLFLVGHITSQLYVFIVRPGGLRGGWGTGGTEEGDLTEELDGV